VGLKSPDGGDGRQGFRRTLVGLKCDDGEAATVDMTFQTYPRGVEVRSQVRTVSDDDVGFQTYPRGVEVKSGRRRDGRQTYPRFKTNPRGVEVSDVPSWG